jgi:hypothetical protein
MPASCREFREGGDQMDPLKFEPSEARGEEPEYTRGWSRMAENRTVVEHQEFLEVLGSGL